VWRWLIPLALAAEPVPERPIPSMCGFDVFRVCGTSQGNRYFPEWVAVAPGVVTTITNPLGSPKGCVKISSLTGRGIYVYGDETTAPALLRRAP
jgi:hypothetical protein